MRFITDQLEKAITNVWFHSNLSFNVATSPYWQAMINAIAVCGLGVKATTYEAPKVEF